MSVCCTVLLAPSWHWQQTYTTVTSPQWHTGWREIAYCSLSTAVCEAVVHKLSQILSRIRQKISEPEVVNRRTTGMMRHIISTAIQHPAPTPLPPPKHTHGLYQALFSIVQNYLQLPRHYLMKCLHDILSWRLVTAKQGITAIMVMLASESTELLTNCHNACVLQWRTMSPTQVCYAPEASLSILPVVYSITQQEGLLHNWWLACETM